MATHFSVLAWRTPGTGHPGGLLSMGSHRVGHNCSDLAAAAAYNDLNNTVFQFQNIGCLSLCVGLLFLTVVFYNFNAQVFHLLG